MIHQNKCIRVGKLTLLSIELTNGQPSLLQHCTQWFVNGISGDYCFKLVEKVYIPRFVGRPPYFTAVSNRTDA